MKRHLILLTCLCVGMFAFCGCSSQEPDAEAKQESSQEKETKAPEDMVYALVTKSEGNRYNELQAQGFRTVIEESGAVCVVEYPKSTAAMEQVRIIEQLIEDDVDAIAIAANDADALNDVLQKARDAGILITTLDSNVNPEYTSLFINQVDTKTVATTLLDAVYDISGGSGEWAILSASSMAPNQNAWIEAMREIMKEDSKYKKLKLVEIAYGEDLERLSKDQTAAILQIYQDLKVICAPTTVGCRAAAEVVSETETECKVTGLALPSEIVDYLGANEVCPYVYIWDSEKVGELAAYATLALMNDELAGTPGQAFTAGDLGKFKIQESEDGGAEIVVGPLLRISDDNIIYWDDIF